MQGQIYLFLPYSHFQALVCGSFLFDCSRLDSSSKPPGFSKQCHTCAASSCKKFGNHLPRRITSEVKGQEHSPLPDQAASASAVDLLCDRYGSHVLRRILSTLSGRDVQPAQSKHLGHGQRAPGGNNREQKRAPPPFPTLLAQFAEGVAVAAGPHLRLDSSAGPGLQVRRFSGHLE